MSGRQRLLLLGLAVVVVVVALVAIRPAGDENSSGAATVEVRDGTPVGGVQTYRWKKGETIDLTVRSDTADEVHLHGYDLHKDVAQGGTVRFRVPATIEGKFEVELEEHKQELANVEVVP